MLGILQYGKYLFPHEFYQIFEKLLGKDERPFLVVYLVSITLFPPCAIILENKSEALGIKSLTLRVRLAIRRSS